MLLRELDAYFRSILRIDDLGNVDPSLNGIQVDRDEARIAKAAFAVDACMTSFRLAAEWGADVLCVHHGLFWGRELRVSGTHRERLKFLIAEDLALYAIHLPLDMHPEIGNIAGIAAALGLTEVVPFSSYKGFDIGVRGVLPRPARVQDIEKKLFGPEPKTNCVLPFGPEPVSSVGIVSGGAAYNVTDAIDKGLDLYITGDSSHSVYHLCQEAGINVIFGGHYRTEVWGIRLLAEKTAKETGIETRFFDVPTGL